MEKITGPALCGFADYFDDERPQNVYTVVGARGSSGGSKQGQPVKVIPYLRAKQSSTIATHAKVLKSARQVLAKAHGQVRKAAKQTLAKPSVAHSAAAHSAAVSRAASPAALRAGGRVMVHGDGYVVVGAAPAPAETPKVKAARAKLAAANDKVRKAKATADTKTKAAHGSVVKLANQVKSHENVARKMSGKKPGASGGGHVRVHGDYVGDDANGLWPGDEGYDASTENGANGPKGANPWDGGAGVVDPASGLPTPTDPTTGAPITPAQLDLDTLVATATAAGKVDPSQPMGSINNWAAIKYDGSKGTPDGYILSSGLATRATDVGCEPDSADIEGNAHFGYVWGRYDKKDPRNGGIGWGSNLTKNAWNHVHGRHHLQPSGTEWFNVVDAAEAYQSATRPVDLGLPGTHTSGYQTTGAYGPDVKSITYGPLVGNPAMENFKNMRVSLEPDGSAIAFWLANEAPDWLTAPLKAQAALTKAAADKAQKDADAAAAAAAVKAAADQAAALAAVQAQNALDEANAASQGRQATSQAQGQADLADAASAQADAQYGQAEASQVQFDAQGSQAQWQQDQAERQAEMQQAQAERQQALQEQQYQFQQYQAAQAAAPAAQRGQDYQQYGSPSQGVDDGGIDEGDGGAASDGGDTALESPEMASDVEAANIEADADALEGVLGRARITGDDAVIGGDGEVIGLDQYGNVSE